MKTNREKLLQDAFVMFLQYNYERASYSLLTQATGISKAGISYYYPTKQELFVAVVDRYFINVHDADVKFTPAASFAEFLDHFVENIQKIQRYYPDAKVKLQAFWEKFLNGWRIAITAAIEHGELRRDIDIELTANMFNNIYLGMSFMKSFSTGLDTGELRRSYDYLYSILKVH